MPNHAQASAKIALQHPKCWIVTTSGIAGLQGNSKIPQGTTVNIAISKFNLLHGAHSSRVFYKITFLGVTQGADFKL